MIRRLSLAAAMVCMSAVVAGAQQSAAPKISKEEATLRATVKVSEDSARAIALKVFPGAVVTAAEVEKEKGKVIWSIELTTRGKKGNDEVNIDAMTGKVLAKEHESDAKEAKEAKDEAKERAKAAKPAKP